MAWKCAILDSKKFDYYYFLQNNVCRLCWSTNGSVNLTSYSPKSVTKEVTISAKILDCLGIDVTLNSHPNMICTNCLKKIDDFDKFRTFCHQSHNKLTEILKNGPTKEEFNSKINDTDSNTFEDEACNNSDENIYNSLKEEHKIDDDIKLLMLEDDRMQLPDKVTIKREIDEALSNFSFDESDTFSEKLINKDIYCYSCRILFNTPENLSKHNLKCHIPIKPSLSSIRNIVKRSYVRKKEKKTTDASFKKQKVKKNETFPCFGCPKLYESYHLRYSHERKHCSALAKGYNCEICNIYLPRRGLFVRHLKEHENLPIDSGKYALTCDKCSEICIGKIALSRHYESHMKHQRYVCEICGKISTDRGNLYNHKLLHNALHKLKCPHCNYRATYKFVLETHIRTHTGERPFACNMCSYKSHSKKSIQRHKRTVHLHIKNIKCPTCQKAFRDRFVLSEHVSAVHLKVKAYSCSQCGEEYILLRALRKHYLEKHGIKVIKEKDALVQIVKDENYKSHKLKIQSIQDVLVKDLDDSKRKQTEPDDPDGDSNGSGDSNKAGGSDSVEFEIPEESDT